MSNQLTPSQVLWAKSHDWFIHMQGDMVVVCDRYVDRFGRLHERTIIWDGTFAELRRWAGY